MLDREADNEDDGEGTEAPITNWRQMRNGYVESCDATGQSTRGVCREECVQGNIGEFRFRRSGRGLEGWICMLHDDAISEGVIARTS